jgi:hypothetical protein
MSDSTPIIVQEVPQQIMLVDEHIKPTRYYFATVMQNGGNISNILIQGSIVRAIIEYKQRGIPVVFTQMLEIAAEEYEQLNAISGT